MSHLLTFGHGYVARYLARELLTEGWRVSGTRRSSGGTAAVGSEGGEGIVFNGGAAAPELAAAVASATHLLVSIPPTEEGDPVLLSIAPAVREALGQRLRWVGYLSTTGVYGDHGGGWVDEDTPPRPGLARTRRRLGAEESWATAVAGTGATLQVFRISGIYGPGRNPLSAIRDGTARRIMKEGSISNRIHVADIVQSIRRGMDHPEHSGVFNLSDDLPSPAHEVVAFGARLLGLDPPPEMPFEEAALSAMARSFYAEDRRVANQRIKDVLGVSLRYPTYREGLAALLDEG